MKNTYNIMIWWGLNERLSVFCVWRNNTSRIMIRVGVLMSGVFGVVGWGRGVVRGTRSSVHVPGLFSVITTLATVTPEKCK